MKSSYFLKWCSFHLSSLTMYTDIHEYLPLLPQRSNMKPFLKWDSHTCMLGVKNKRSQIPQHLFLRYLRHQGLTDSIPFDAMGKCFFEWLCSSNSKNIWLRFRQNHVSICVCDIHINLIHFGNIYFSFDLLFNRII